MPKTILIIKTTENITIKKFRYALMDKFGENIISIKSGDTEQIQKDAAKQDEKACRHSTECSLGYNCKKNLKECEEYD